AEQDVDDGGSVAIRPTTSYFTIDASPIDDVDGDGIGDFALSLADAILPGTAASIVLLRGQSEWPSILDPESNDPGILARITGPNRSLGGEIVWVPQQGGLGWLLASPSPNSDGGRETYLLPLSSDASGMYSVEEWLDIFGGVTFERVRPGNVRASYTHVATPGDIDGDGFEDLLISDELGGSANRGITFLLRGRSTWPKTVVLDDA